MDARTWEGKRMTVARLTQAERAGLADALIREAMAAVDCDWAALCAEARRRKFGEPPVDRAGQLRQHSHLAQRGFSGEHIRAALADDAVPDT
jgi:regulatory protein